MSKDLPKFSVNLDDNVSGSQKKGNTLKKIPTGQEGNNTNGLHGEHSSHVSAVNGTVSAVKHVCCSRLCHTDSTGGVTTTTSSCACKRTTVTSSKAAGNNTGAGFTILSSSSLNSQDKVQSTQNNLGFVKDSRGHMQRCFSDGVLEQAERNQTQSNLKCISISENCMCGSMVSKQPKNNIPVSTLSSSNSGDNKTPECTVEEKEMNNLGTTSNASEEDGAVGFSALGERGGPLVFDGISDDLMSGQANGLCHVGSNCHVQRSDEEMNASHESERTETKTNNLDYHSNSRSIDDCSDENCDIYEHEMNMIFGSPIHNLRNNGFEDAITSGQLSHEIDSGSAPDSLSSSYLDGDSVAQANEESSTNPCMSKDNSMPNMETTAYRDNPSLIGIVKAPLALPEDISEYDSDESCDENLCRIQPKVCDCDNVVYPSICPRGRENCDRKHENTSEHDDTKHCIVSSEVENTHEHSESHLMDSACALPPVVSNSSHPYGATVLYDASPFPYEHMSSEDFHSFDDDHPLPTRRRRSSSDSLEEIGDYIEADLPPRSERLAFFSRGSSSSTSTDEDEGCGEEVLINGNDESDNETINPHMSLEESSDWNSDVNRGVQPGTSWHHHHHHHHHGTEGAASNLVSKSSGAVYQQQADLRQSSSETDHTSTGLGFSMSDLSEIASTDAESGLESVFPSVSTSSSGAFVQYCSLQTGEHRPSLEEHSSEDSLFQPAQNYSLDSSAFYLPRQNHSLDFEQGSASTVYGAGAQFNRRSRSLDQALALTNNPDDVGFGSRSFDGDSRNQDGSGSNFLHDEINLQEKVFQKLSLDHPPHHSCSSDEEESNSPRDGRGAIINHSYNRYPSRGGAHLEYNRNLLGQIPRTPIEQNIVMGEEEPIYEDIDDLQLSEDMFCSDSEPDNVCPPPSASFAVSKRRRGKRPRSPISDIKKVMIWHEYEAFAVQVKEIGMSACGPTAVLNALKAFDIQAEEEDVTNVVVFNARMEAAPVPYYLFSRSKAGATAESLIAGMTQITRGMVKGRFFHFYPPREVELLKWLGDWMQKGAVPIATLNLQRGVKPGWTIPDAWHHQMIYGVSHRGVYLTNPLELVSESLIMEQLSSDSVLLVRRQDIVSRFRDWCPLNEILKQRDPRWRTMNVLGQVVHILRERSTPADQVPVIPAQLTPHVKIPAVYRAGITLFIRGSMPACEELMTCPELPLKHPDPTTTAPTLTTVAPTSTTVAPTSTTVKAIRATASAP